MKVAQTVTIEGLDIVLTLTEEPAGNVLLRRRWIGAGKYVRPGGTKGYFTLMIPKQAGLDILRESKPEA